MIYIDDRAGSNELAAPLQHVGLPVELTRLSYGDVCFEGRGEKGKPVSVGIEFKKLGELVRAIKTERLQGYQLVGMRPCFDYCYLFIEGELLYGRDGLLQKRTKFNKHPLPLEGKMTVGELLKRINVLHLCGGLNPQWFSTRRDTLQGIEALYHSWADTDLDQHKSHLGIYNAPSIVPVSELRRVLSTFPHIGRRVSLAVEEHFKTLDRAVTASAEEWAGIQVMDDKGRTKRLGMKVAMDIVQFCKGA